MVTSTFVSSNYAPLTSDENNVLYQTSSTKLTVNDKELGVGTLFISKSNVTWSNTITTESPRRVSLLYPTISFHGIQRVPTPALYMVINYDLSSMLQELNTPTNSANENDDETAITELRFVPQNVNDLEEVNTALIEGQRLHPDPTDEVSDEENENEGTVDIFQEAEELFDDVTDDVIHRLHHLRLSSDGTHYIEDYYDDDDAEDRGR